MNKWWTTRNQLLIYNVTIYVYHQVQMIRMVESITRSEMCVGEDDVSSEMARWCPFIMFTLRTPPFV